MPVLFIGRIPRDTRNSELQDLFREYGPINDILIKNGYGFVELENSRDADEAVNRLHGREFLGEKITVEYAKNQKSGSDRRRDRSRDYGRPSSRDRDRDRDYRDYGRDRYDRDRDYDRRGGRYDDDRRDRGRASNSFFRLFADNLSHSASWQVTNLRWHNRQDLKDLIKSTGVDVGYTKIRDGEGIAEFYTYDDMKHVIKKLDDTELKGKRLVLRQDTRHNEALRERKERSRSPAPRRASRSPGAPRRSRRSPSRSASRSRDEDKEVPREPEDGRRDEPMNDRSPQDDLNK